MFGEAPCFLTSLKLDQQTRLPHLVCIYRRGEPGYKFTPLMREENGIPILKISTTQVGTNIVDVILEQENHPFSLGL